MDTMAAFWSETLAMPPRSIAPGDEFRLLQGTNLTVSPQLARTPVTARDEMHLDHDNDDKAAEVQRVVALGAIWLRSSNDPNDDYDVLQDPEGNEFCIVAISPDMA